MVEVSVLILLELNVTVKEYVPLKGITTGEGRTPTLGVNKVFEDAISTIFKSAESVL